MAETRWELWSVIEAALRASFPDRAEEMLSAVERRLEPGPWSAAVDGRAGTWSRDRVLADVGRALRSVEGDAETRLRELERWMTDSALAGLSAHLGLRWIIPEWNQAIIDWAASALEAGLDVPSLRILAGERAHETHEVEEYVRRTVRELRLERSDEGDLRAAGLHLAREAVQGRIDPVTASRRLYDIATSLPPGNDFEIWRQIELDSEMDLSERGVETYEQQVIVAARSLLGV